MGLDPVYPWVTRDQLTTIIYLQGVVSCNPANGLLTEIFIRQYPEKVIIANTVKQKFTLFKPFRRLVLRSTCRNYPVAFSNSRLKGLMMKTLETVNLIAVWRLLLILHEIPANCRGLTSINQPLPHPEVDDLFWKKFICRLVAVVTLPTLVLAAIMTSHSFRLFFFFGHDFSVTLNFLSISNGNSSMRLNTKNSLLRSSARTLKRQPMVNSNSKPENGSYKSYRRDSGNGSSEQ
ncbi:hypothetical protein OUZ56_030445 [Daphnia magna]|uniref:Uncharacterized protein n=1 Tax=Daphnia magna TaxID=35525 RepID=A0ABQ9ZRB0_9CRUS|nr:hypothetical protein OUZ56_030445 [Daphnia magna]